VSSKSFLVDIFICFRVVQLHLVER